ncbi:MAG: HDIG domain-containing protein [Planctomycetes bacterium]|nr:HDIG domain-containing protein [Planctomycetota bacterium]
MNRDQAWQLVCENVESVALRQHMLSVEAAMRTYSEIMGGDADTWGIVGLLHDFDYERWPEPPAHTREGAAILRDRGVDEETIGAIMSHAEWNHEQYPLDRPIRKALTAVDELCGFVYAVALVRPTRLDGMEPSSVKKKLKATQFAAAVSRANIHRGAELVGWTLDEHIENCIRAMQGVAGEIGLKLGT